MSFNDCKGCPAEYEPCLKDSFGDNPAHIIVIGPAPSGFSIGQEQAFYGRHGRLFKQLLDIIRQYNGGVYAGVKAHYTYAAMVGAYEPKARHLEKCRPIMQRHFRKVSGFGNRRPILVPLGPIAAKAVGLNFRKITDIVGREMTTTTAGDTYTVVPLLSMRHLEAKIGVANVVLSSLLKAVSIAYGDKQKDLPLEVITKDYIYPRTIEEVRDLVDHVINYYDPEHGNGPEQWAISLDTETNTLKPFSHPDPKVLMLSVGWDDRRAATILLDHPETPYDSAEAWTHVNRLLTCAKPKCFHNWKFDKKFLETVYGYRVNRVTWDTLLGEHYIDEDKKGHYSLKQLTPIYCPEYEGYDDKLHEILRGHEDKEDEEDDYEEGDVPPLLLSDEEILDRNEQLGCPDDRATTAWMALVGAVDERQALKKIATKERTPEQKRKFTDLKKEIDAARKAMNIMAPQRKAKKEKNSKDKGFSQVPLDTILQYAAVDADVTRLILRAQVSRLRNADDWEDGKRVMKYLYLPGTHTLSNMEFRGFQLNGGYQGNLIGEVQTRINDVKNLIAAKFDPMLNLNAPHQISEYMSRLNFESLPGEEDGSTGKDILAKYEKKYPRDDPRHVFVTKLLEYRESSTVMTTYLRPYTRLAKDDGKIHCQFHLNGTSTGRLSSSKPNLQNVPYIAARRTAKNEVGEEVVVHPGYNIKKLFVPSKPDYAMVNVDIKGAELRVYTAYSKDPLMIEALLKGMDVHSLVTSRVYKIPYDEVNAKKETDPDIKEKRTRCKRTVFGTFYGAGPFKIAQQINSTKEEAEQLQNFLFTEFPALADYVEGVRREVEKYQVVGTFFGRKRRFRLAHINHKNRAEAVREAVNFKIQSTSADLVLSQLCEMDEHSDEIGAEMLITVHDSIVLQMPQANLNLLHPFLDKWIVKRVAEKYDWLPVPFLYDVEVGPSYGEVKPFDRKDVNVTQEKAAG